MKAVVIHPFRTKEGKTLGRGDIIDFEPERILPLQRRRLVDIVEEAQIPEPISVEEPEESVKKRGRKKRSEAESTD